MPVDLKQRSGNSHSGNPLAPSPSHIPAMSWPLKFPAAVPRVPHRTQGKCPSRAELSQVQTLIADAVNGSFPRTLPALRRSSLLHLLPPLQVPSLEEGICEMPVVEVFEVEGLAT